MEEIVTSAQMRAIEASAIAAGAVTGRELMERAGAGAVAAILAEWPDLAAGPRRAVVLCGPGNNGGDGFVVARLLAARGWGVRVWHWGDPARMTPDAAAACRAWRAVGAVGSLGAGMVPRWFRDHDAVGADPGPGDLVVDALFGIGLTRAATALQPVFGRYCAPGRAWRVAALDLPSGFDADTGALPPGDDPPSHATADLTLAFHARKPGHLADPCRAACGRVAVVDIGLPRASS